ncbi:MAG: PqqD family protein [Betaproteobacteria bacterium]
MGEEPLPARQASCSGRYVTRRIAGETIVVPIRAEAAQLDSVYVFNEVGARIWELIESGRPEEAVIASLTEEFEVDAERARADLTAFVDVLRQAGLVEAVRP